jgi:ribosomal protein S18 acetylase RimI-like enzyme
MATVPVAAEIEVLDLRHFSARQMRPLLEREARVWRERLLWDYRSATELLLQYLESRILQGFCALDRGRVCGYAFCVYEGNKAVIGDVFAAGHRTRSDVETAQTLLVHMLEMLRHSPMVDRVESQLLLYEAGEFAEVLGGPGLKVCPRLFLECEIARPVDAAAAEAREASVRGLAAELTLTQWVALDYQAAGELIYACYAGHADAEINDQYRSMHGSLRFLHNIVRFPGCGVFDAGFSWMLRDRRSGAMVGMVLCSRVGERVAHITQLCLAPAYRGRGLGLVLLQQSAESLRRAGFEVITLTVTEANAPALHLYERFGFRPRHRFDAMVLDTRNKSH